MKSRLADKIIESVENSRKEIVRLTQDLVRIPSENTPPRGNEKKCQEFIAAKLREFGLEVDVFTPKEVRGIESHPAFFNSREYVDRPNVVGRTRGRGGRSLILGGHIDTVAIGRQSWHHNPFGGMVEDGKLYGRGALDMKGGVAAAIIAVKCLQDVGFRGKLIVESVVDEEFAGANGTLACLLRGYEADAAIISEPTYLRIYPAHRGLRMAHITIRAKGGVPFTSGNLINPVFKAAKFIDALSEFERNRQIRAKETPLYPLYSKYEKPAPLMVTKVKAGDLDPTTPLIMPDECFLELFWETMPREKKENVEKEFANFVEEILKGDEWLKNNPPRVDYWLRWLPGSGIEPSHPIVKTLSKYCQRCTGRESEIVGAPFPSDLFMFNLYSRTPAVAFGPGGGNAHANDEFVCIEDLITTTKVLALTAASWCSGEIK